MTKEQTEALIDLEYSAWKALDAGVDPATIRETVEAEIQKEKEEPCPASS
jgi:hypothetical protein